MAKERSGVVSGERARIVVRCGFGPQRRNQTHSSCAPVAQLDRALASEAKGREFEPHQAHHFSVLLLWNVTPRGLSWNFVTASAVTRARRETICSQAGPASGKKMAFLGNDSANHPWNATVYSYCRDELAAAGMVPFNV